MALLKIQQKQDTLLVRSSSTPKWKKQSDKLLSRLILNSLIMELNL